MTQPTIGRVVHYQLSEADAEAINRRRADADAHRRAYPRPDEPGGLGATGHVMHVGNRVEAGQAYPATVVRVFGNDPYANLQVLLDGTDTYWATSRCEGNRPGQWTWPPRV